MKMPSFLKSKLEFIKMFVNHTPVAYIIMDKNYQIYYINDSFAKLRKLDKASVIGNKCYNISNNGIRCVNCAVAKTLETGEKAFVSRKDILPDNTVRFIDDYAIPLQKNENGETEFILEIMINRTEEMLAKEQRNKDYSEILSILSSLLEAKDAYTAKHSDNVRKLALNLAGALSLTPDEIFEISVAASLHDIGKIEIPDAIINKPDFLTEEEYSKIKEHPITSYNILNGLTSFDNIRAIALQHHERIDGCGYPNGLAGDEISLGAKIIAVADTYDAITTTRSYREARSHEDAMAEIMQAVGSQLDAKVVQTFTSMDFSNLSDVLYDIHLRPNSHQVERILEQPILYSEKPEHFTLDDFNMQQDLLFDEIFKNTPCGYVLMDCSRTVLYASDYFLSFMGLSEDDVLNKTCYTAGGFGPVPCPNCPITKALTTGKPAYIRQEQTTRNGQKTFDLYGVPLIEDEGTMPYVIEIIIDRTEEIKLETARQQDFSKLIQLLKTLATDHQNEISKQTLIDHITDLDKRFHQILGT